ncbi:hypothetical protein QNE85_004089 [Vibrio fluvialis]|nr:hypothetical protein [Vibrio fluvialis]
MSRTVKVTPKAMSAMESIPRDVRVKARRAVDWLKSDNERSLKPISLSPRQRLFRSALGKGYWIVYAKQNGTTRIVDIVQEKKVSEVMRVSK